jgi:hypothetical protein
MSKAWLAFRVAWFAEEVLWNENYFKSRLG